MIYQPCHVVFSKPKMIDGILHRGFMTTDNLDNLDQQFNRELWALGVFFHSPMEAWFDPRVDLYFKPHSYAACPDPWVTITDRDLTDDYSFFPRTDIEAEYDVIFNMNWMPFKRHELFIEALLYAKRARRPIRVLWFGYHYDEVSKAREVQFKKQIHEAGLDVTFLDTNFDPREINRRYNLAKCAVICSTGEGGPRVFAESLFAGLPLIVTEDTRGGVPESLVPECGLTCEPIAPAIASTIWNVLDKLDEFTPRHWALDNLARSMTEVRLREALWRLSQTQAAEHGPINWQEACFTGYDWETKKQVVRQAEAEFLAGQSAD